MNKLLVSLLAATALAGCAASTSSAPTAVAEQAAPAPKPAYGSFGFDTAGMDKSVKPGNDFYEYADGTWAKNTPVPSDKSNYGMFGVLDDLSTQRTHGILEELKGDPNSKIGAAYATYLDQPAIEAKGLAPIQPWFARIKGLKSKAGYAALAAEANRNGVGLPFGAGVGQDDKRPDSYVMGIRQAGLGMPDRDYYLEKTGKLAETRAAYLAYLAQMLTLAGEPNAAARAAAVLDFETKIATVSWTRIDSRDANKTNNPMSLVDLQKRAPGFDWTGYFKAAGFTLSDVDVAQPSAVTGIAALIRDTPLAVLKDSLILRSLASYAGVLPSAFDTANFAFQGQVLSGIPEQEVRWKRAVSFTSSALSDDVSKIYVERYFPPETKAAADDLVKNVLAAMGARIDKLTWMAPETKVKAHAKLAAFTPKIGYPSQWKDYSALQIVPGDALGNAMRARQWQSDDNRSKLGTPVRRWEWGMTPMTINAYANFGMVEIVFPAAILQPPFFDPNADPAVNYGGIGVVIGHELSHHFDDQGSKYDATGRLSDWWTPTDVANFKALTGKLVAQYDAYEPMPGLHVKGGLTLGENIGDLAGLAVAHDAYLKSLGGKPAPVIDGYTADQRFYLAYAQVWRRNVREAEARKRLLTDPHSPSAERVASVRNQDAWYSAFDPKPGEKLYLAPDQRVRIW